MEKAKFIHNATQKILLQSQLNVLKTIVEHGKITIAFHCIGMIEPEFSLVDIQCLLLIYGCLDKQVGFLRVT